MKRTVIYLPVIVCVFFLLALPACETAKSKARPQIEKNPDLGPFGGRSPHLFLPLNLGNTWVYEKDYLGEKGEVTVRIESLDKNGFFHDNQGGKLKHTRMGVRDEHRYLLLAPLETGKKWRSQVQINVAEHFEIVDDNRSVETKAGTFEHCVVVRSVTKLNKSVRMVNVNTYAPRVGIVKTETWLENDRYRKKRQVHLELKSYELP